MAPEAPHVSTGPFARALEPSFSQLPEPLRAFHGVAKFQRFTGMAELEVSTSPIARTVLWLAGFPRQSGTVPLVVEVEVTNHVETWRRDFGSKPTVSTLQFREGLVLETFGLVTCALDLRCDEDRIVVGVGRAWIFRVIPLPRALTPISTSVE